MIKAKTDNANKARAPLAGVRVLDFSTLLPGPLASLILAEAGAEVIKLERPGVGDEMRHMGPKLSGEGIWFALLNRGKQSLSLDLKSPEGKETALALAAESHVIIEQFRPGVMDRLGLGYEAMRAVNPALVYCAITGYGQTGPLAQMAGHDLNYIAETGLLAQGADDAGKPVIPPGLIADIGGGSLPAVINILLALRQAEATGTGCKLDIAMADNLFCWQFLGLGSLEADGRSPVPGREILTGGSPRYRLYQSADGHWLSVAALEQRFWTKFCALIQLPDSLRDDSRDPEATAKGIAARITSRPRADWEVIFEGEDVCCRFGDDIASARTNPHFMERGLFEKATEVGTEGQHATALPVPLAPELQASPETASAPSLGSAKTTEQH